MSALLGSIYVIGYDNGITKVGMSDRAERRLVQHEASASAHGVGVLGRWVSPVHLGYRASETDLIRRCSEVADLAHGREYFRMPFWRAVEIAEDMEISESTTEEISAALEEAEKCVKGLMASIMQKAQEIDGGGWQRPAIDEFGELRSTVSGFRESVAEIFAAEGDPVGFVRLTLGDHEHAAIFEAPEALRLAMRIMDAALVAAGKGVASSSGRTVDVED